MATQLTAKKSVGAAPFAYIRLMRLNRPIGIYLVMWPTLWALWLAAEGSPDLKILLIFIAGCVLMRSAGCVINDYADRNIDPRVKRTHERPLARGEVTVREALALFGLLCACAFLLVLFTNTLTIQLSLVGAALAIIYPFTKRYSQLPQVVLGAAFAWSIPMAFAAQTGTVPQPAWLIFVSVLLWTVCYDTFYAMVDREDDIKIGVKSTAVLFGDMDRMMTASLQVLTVLALVMVGLHFELSVPYYLGLAGASGCFIYQQVLIREREPEQCFKAFLNNNWAGMAIFIGIVAHFAVSAGAS